MVIKRMQRTIRLRKNLIEYIDKIAFEDNRKFDNMIETILLIFKKNNEYKDHIDPLEVLFKDNHIPYKEYNRE